MRLKEAGGLNARAAQLGHDAFRGTRRLLAVPGLAPEAMHARLEHVRTCTSSLRKSRTVPAPGVQEVNAPWWPLRCSSTRTYGSPTRPGSTDPLGQGRRAGETIPPATLTHELGGAACPRSKRALLRTGPHSHIRVQDAAAGQSIDYGPTKCAAVLAEVDKALASLAGERALWPGDGLLPPVRAESRTKRPSRPAALADAGRHCPAATSSRRTCDTCFSRAVGPTCPRPATSMAEPVARPATSGG